MTVAEFLKYVDDHVPEPIRDSTDIVLGNTDYPVKTVHTMYYLESQVKTVRLGWMEAE